MPETRESPVVRIIEELKEFGVEIYGYDPLLSKEEIEGFGVVALDELNVKMDCVIMAAAHNEFKEMKLEDLARMMSNKPVLIDVRGLFNNQELKREGFYYKTL